MSEEKIKEPKQEMNPGDYVITKNSVGKIIGQSSGGNYVVEWTGDAGEQNFVEYKEAELVVIDIVEDLSENANVLS